MLLFGFFWGGGGGFGFFSGGGQGGCPMEWWFMDWISWVLVLQVFRLFK